MLVLYEGSNTNSYKSMAVNSENKTPSCYFLFDSEKFPVIVHACHLLLTWCTCM